MVACSRLSACLVLLLSTWTQTNKARYLLILFLNQVFNISRNLDELLSHLSIDILHTHATQKDNSKVYFTTLFKYLTNNFTYNCGSIDIREKEQLYINKEHVRFKKKALEDEQKHIKQQKIERLALIKKQEIERLVLIEQQEIDRLVQAERTKSENDKRLKSIIICIFCISSVLMYAYLYGYSIHFTKQINDRNKKRVIIHNPVQNL